MSIFREKTFVYIFFQMISLGREKRYGVKLEEKGSFLKQLRDVTLILPKVFVHIRDYFGVTLDTVVFLKY